MPRKRQNTCINITKTYSYHSVNTRAKCNAMLRSIYSLISQSSAKTVVISSLRNNLSRPLSAFANPSPSLPLHRVIVIPARNMASASLPDRYKLIFYVPHSDLEKCKEAVFATGAGTFPGGKYSKCCFQMPGTGQFLPGDGADPAIGSVGALEYVEEMKVEVMCVGREVMLKAVEALVEAHPYEEVAYEVYRMENV